VLHKLSSGETGNLCYFFINTETEISTPVVPVGYPVEGKEISIVDDQGQAVGINQVGEIVVRSRYLSDGYWRKTELTSSKFFTDQDEAGRRGCFTGDLGRLLPDGCLVYLGRKDTEVNIRGYRVAPIEIEMALLEHPGVKDAGITAWIQESGENYLAAYIVPADAHAVTSSELGEFLRTKLPDYMIPTRFEFLNSLPQTNGKLDRKKLPKPDDKVTSTCDPAQDDVEKSLVRIWEEVLEVRPIGVRDNFFDIGGHSLVAIQLIATIEKTLGKKLLPAILFQAPTIEQLARVLRREQPTVSWSSLLPIQPDGLRPPFFWIHGDYSNALLPRYLPPDQPLYGLEHQSQDGQPARYTQIETIAAHYLEEIQTVQRQGPYFVGGYSFGGAVAFEMARKLKNQGQEVGLLVLLDPPAWTSAQSIGRRDSSHNGDSEKTQGFRDKLHRQMDKMTRLTVQEKCTYLLVKCREKIAAVITDRTSGLIKLMKRISSMGYLALGHPLPRSLRSSYILAIYHQARKQYRPQPYAGAAILFMSKGRPLSYPEHWKRLITGNIEIHEVDADHMEIRQNPSVVHLWAETLQRSLSKAQARNDPDSAFIADRLSS
jgi:thioesterase domain-containing protein/acyl carrier protein